jgi:predicted DNA-binding antitoxin AbrB/MazE fold protein
MDHVMKRATFKARYVDKVLKPLGELDRKDGDEVVIKVQGSATSRIFGIVKCWEGLEEAHEDYKTREWPQTMATLSE